MTEQEFEKFAKNLGEVIDMPYDEFETRIREEAIPVGILQNMRVLFVASFNNLIERKNALLEKVQSGELPMNDDNKKVLMGIYNEMLKIEEKSEFLVERIAELLKLDI